MNVLTAVIWTLVGATMQRQTPKWDDLTSVLMWMSGVGGPYVVGKIIAYLAENWSTWHTLSRPVKTIIPMLLSVLIGVGATYLVERTDIVTVLSPAFTIVAGALICYLGSQEGYMNARKTNYGLSAKVKANLKKFP